jgi:hypothetical protein
MAQVPVSTSFLHLDRRDALPSQSEETSNRPWLRYRSNGAGDGSVRGRLGQAGVHAVQAESDLRQDRILPG